MKNALFLVFLLLCGCAPGQRLEQKVGTANLSLNVPEGWRVETTGANQSSWTHPKLGRLSIQVLEWAAVADRIRAANTAPGRAEQLEQDLLAVAGDPQVVKLLTRVAEARAQKLDFRAALEPTQPPERSNSEASLRLQAALTGLLRPPLSYSSTNRMLVSPGLALLTFHDRLVVLRYPKGSELPSLLKVGPATLPGLNWLWIVVGLVSLVTALGAYSGYQADSAEGASRGAHRAAMPALNLLLFLGVVALWWWALRAPARGEMISPLGLAGGVTLVGIPLGFLLNYCYALGAGAAAYQASRHGARAAALAAPLGGLVGITCSLLTLAVLHFINPVRRRRRDYTNV